MRLNGYTGTITEKDGFLYQDGKTDYAILLPENASESDIYASAELTEIFALAGVPIRTVFDDDLAPDPEKRFIAIGKTIYFNALGVKMRADEYKFDGFLIESIGNTYVIKGVGDTGTLMGVYGFAEYAMGYVHYASDERKAEPSAPLKEFHIKDIPTFFGRYAFGYHTTNDVENGFRLRNNGEFARREKKHGEGRPWSTLSDQSNALQILDFRKYQPLHPDWFYLEPGHELFPPPNCYPQICYSKGLYDDEFFSTFVRNLIDNYIVPESDRSFFMLGMCDNTDFCPCVICTKEVKKYTRSGLSMRFVNKVADAVEKWRLENAPERVIYLLTFAYLTTFDPPVVEKNGAYVPIDPSVRALPNVIVQFAPIHANYLYPLDDEIHNRESRRALFGWHAVADNMCVWDYRQDFYSLAFPYPFSVTAQKNNDLYAELGMLEVFNQGQRFCGGSPFAEMDDFARSRLHWNAKEDYRELIEEFSRAFYKDASPFVLEYLDAIEKYYKVMETRGYRARYNDKAILRRYYYTVDELYSLLSILNRALEAVKTNERVYDRVNELTLFPKAALLFCFPLDLPKDDALSLLDDFVKCADKYELTYFHKRKYTTKDVLDEICALITGEITENERKYRVLTPEDP